MLQNLHGDGVLDKVSDKGRKLHHQLAQKILQNVVGFFENAIRDGHLPTTCLSAKAPVYGLWSMCDGDQLPRCYQRPLTSPDITNSANTMFSLVQVMLDGLGWQPQLSTEQTSQLLQRCSNEFFAAEIEQTRQMITLSI